MTKGEFGLWCFLFFVLTALLIMIFGSGCATPSQTLDVTKTFRHELRVDVNGERFDGIGVAKVASKYKVEIKPDERADRIILQTCHREELFPKGNWLSPKKVEIDLKPVQEIEGKAPCALLITALTKADKADFALIDFQDRRPEVSLPATVRCNGVTKSVSGVSICQSAAGLTQEIEFQDMVLLSGVEAPCNVITEGTPLKRFRFLIPSGKCTYNFVSRTRHANGLRLVHRLNTIGYNEIILR